MKKISAMPKMHHDAVKDYLNGFFETQERYRRREMRGWFAMLFRVAIVVGALWFGWVWGKAEQSSLQAEADLVIYENNVRIKASLVMRFNHCSARLQKLRRPERQNR